MTSTTQNATHTPGPWNAIQPIRAKHSWDWAIENEHEVFLKLEYMPPTYHPDGMDGWRKEAQANAEFIVRACNSHAAMLEALKAADAKLVYILGRLGEHHNGEYSDEQLHADMAGIDNVADYVQAAIAKAQGS